VPIGVAPNTLPEVAKFILQPAGRPALQVLHKFRRRHIWRARHQHVNMIRRHRTAHNHHFPAVTDLSSQVARLLAHSSAQDLVPVLRNPYEMMLDIEHRVRPGPVLAHPSIFAAGGSQLIA
jgi:hypothetical protein